MISGCPQAADKLQQVKQGTQAYDGLRPLIMSACYGSMEHALPLSSHACGAASASM